MAHWDGKFSIGTYLILKDTSYDYGYNKNIQIVDRNAFNYYTIKIFNDNFDSVKTEGMFKVDDTELHTFYFIEQYYKVSTSKLLQNL